jgi:hypothetical protein
LSATTRNAAPVFVVGSPRSGTTLLYHMLLSAGGFAYYRAETHVYNMLAPRFGDLAKRETRLAMFDVFARSDMFRIAGLETGAMRAIIDRECRTAGDFLRLFMEAVARQQGVPRWAETTPIHVLYMDEIKRHIPDALFIHVIRDGRDVAVSMAKQKWVRPLPGLASTPERAAGAYWSWIVDGGRRLGGHHRDDYMEVFYEALVDSPEKTLASIGEFIAQPLSHAEIQRVGIGSVSRPNTSFPGSGGSFSGRWRGELDAPRAERLEALLAPTLERAGYRLELPGSSHAHPVASLERAAYARWFGSKQWLKVHTPLGRRLASLELFEPGAVKGDQDFAAMEPTG